MAFDLDDEELKATRKLNGSDKNVGSIEEDIKILEDFTKIVKGKDYNAKNGWHGYYDDELMNLGTAIEHLLKAYKELEEENKIIKGNYITLCADIQMVTSELGFPGDTIIADEMIPMIKENYIPVSLVEKKIEEIKNETWYIDCGVEAKQSCIEVLQELLEKRK